MYNPIGVLHWRTLAEKRSTSMMLSWGGGGGGLLPSKRLLAMCRWMGSHFHNWVDYNEVTFRTHTPKSKKGPPDRMVKYLKWYKNDVIVVGLTIWMHFQQFEDLNFLIFTGEHAPVPPKNPCRVSNYLKISGIVPILLENPESRLNFSRNTASIPILKISSHKPTRQRNIFLLNYHNMS